MFVRMQAFHHTRIHTHAPEAASIPTYTHTPPSIHSCTNAPEEVVEGREEQGQGVVSHREEELLLFYYWAMSKGGVVCVDV